MHSKSHALENCWGFIDGTVRPICRPGENQKVVYNGHKRVHALKYQSVVAANGLVANLYGPVSKWNIVLIFFVSVVYSMAWPQGGMSPLFAKMVLRTSIKSMRN